MITKHRCILHSGVWWCASRNIYQPAAICIVKNHHNTNKIITYET